MVRPVLVEQHLRGFVGERRLYRHGGQDQLVFRPTAAAGCDVAETAERGRFGPIVVHGATSRTETLSRVDEA